MPNLDSLFATFDAKVLSRQKDGIGGMGSFDKRCQGARPYIARRFHFDGDDAPAIVLQQEIKFAATTSGIRRHPVIGLYIVRRQCLHDGVLGKCTLEIGRGDKARSPICLEPQTRIDRKLIEHEARVGEIDLEKTALRNF